MKDYEVHEFIMEHLCKEIEQIADNIRKDGSMSAQDLDRLDKLYHLKKDLLACKGMEESSEGFSGRRGRGMDGRYVSRDMNDSQSYAEGYTKGYSEAMNQGHIPMMPYPDRRW